MIPIIRVIPKGYSVGPDLIWVDQAVVQLGSIIKGLMEQQDKGLTSDWIIISCSSSHDGNILGWCNRLVIGIDICNFVCVFLYNEVGSQATSISVGITLIVGNCVWWRLWGCFLDGVDVAWVGCGDIADDNSMRCVWGVCFVINRDTAC